MADSLSKFGVPLGGGEGRGGLLSLKIKHRWRVRVINFGPIAGGIEFTQFVEKAQKPQMSQPRQAVHAYNSVAYYLGKHEWEETTMTLKDDLANTVHKLVEHQRQKQMNHREQTAFAAGINYKFTTIIETLDGGNDTVIDSWTLEGCALTRINGSELDYASSEYQTIELTMTFDNAINSYMTDTPELIPGVRI